MAQRKNGNGTKARAPKTAPVEAIRLVEVAREEAQAVITSAPHVPGELVVQRAYMARVRVRRDYTVLIMQRPCGHQTEINVGVGMDIAQPIDFTIVKGERPGQVTLLESCLDCEEASANA